MSQERKASYCGRALQRSLATMSGKAAGYYERPNPEKRQDRTGAEFGDDCRAACATYTPSFRFFAWSLSARLLMPDGNLAGSACISPLTVRFGDHTPASKLMYSNPASRSPLSTVTRNDNNNTQRAVQKLGQVSTR